MADSDGMEASEASEAAQMPEAPTAEASAPAEAPGSQLPSQPSQGSEVSESDEQERLMNWVPDMGNWKNVPEVLRDGIMAAHKRWEIGEQERKQLRKDVTRMEANLRRAQEKQVASLNEIKQAMADLQHQQRMQVVKKPRRQSSALIPTDGTGRARAGTADSSNHNRPSSPSSVVQLGRGASNLSVHPEDRKRHTVDGVRPRPASVDCKEDRKRNTVDGVSPANAFHGAKPTDSQHRGSGRQVSLSNSPTNQETALQLGSSTPTSTTGNQGSQSARLRLAGKEEDASSSLGSDESEEEDVLTLEDRRRLQRIEPLESKLSELSGVSRSMRHQVSMLSEKLETAQSRLTDMWGRMSDFTEDRIRDVARQSAARMMPRWLEMVGAIEEDSDDAARAFFQRLVTEAAEESRKIREEVSEQEKSFNVRIQNLELEIFEDDWESADGGGMMSRRMTAGSMLSDDGGNMMTRRSSFRQIVNVLMSQKAASSSSSSSSSSFSGSDDEKELPCISEEEAKKKQRRARVMSFQGDLESDSSAPSHTATKEKGVTEESRAPAIQVINTERVAAASDDAQGHPVTPPSQSSRPVSATRSALKVNHAFSSPEGASQAVTPKISTTASSRFGPKPMLRRLSTAGKGKDKKKAFSKAEWKQVKETVSKSTVQLQELEESLQQRQVQLEEQEATLMEFQGLMAFLSEDIREDRTRSMACVQTLEMLTGEVKDLRDEVTDDVQKKLKMVEHIDEAWVKDLQNECRGTTLDCINRLSHEMDKWCQHAALVFPRAMKEQAESGQFSITEARLYSLDTRLDVLEEKVSVEGIAFPASRQVALRRRRQAEGPQSARHEAKPPGSADPGCLAIGDSRPASAAPSGAKAATRARHNLLSSAAPPGRAGNVAPKVVRPAGSATPRTRVPAPRDPGRFAVEAASGDGVAGRDQQEVFVAEAMAAVATIGAEREHLLRPPSGNAGRWGRQASLRGSSADSSAAAADGVLEGAHGTAPLSPSGISMPTRQLREAAEGPWIRSVGLRVASPLRQAAPDGAEPTLPSLPQNSLQGGNEAELPATIVRTASGGSNAGGAPVQRPATPLQPQCSGVGGGTQRPLSGERPPSGGRLATPRKGYSASRLVQPRGTVQKGAELAEFTELQQLMRHECQVAAEQAAAAEEAAQHLGRVGG